MSEPPQETSLSTHQHYMRRPEGSENIVFNKHSWERQQQKTRGPPPLLSPLISDINKQPAQSHLMCTYAALQSDMKCLAHRAVMFKKEWRGKKRQTRSSFDFAEDVVEHREQNKNSFTAAGAGDLFVHIQQVK